jgi:hypothetical protein
MENLAGADFSGLSLGCLLNIRCEVACSILWYILWESATYINI